MPRKKVKKKKKAKAQSVKRKATKKKAKRKVGRPRETFLTKAQLMRMDRMAMDQCKHRTIAEALGISRDHLRQHYLPRLLKKGALGRVELQRDQRKMQKKQPSVAIFRGKNYLGQTDKQEIKHGVTEETATLLGMIDGKSKGKLPDAAEGEDAG